ncbi:MAG: hypothetical protein IPH22_13145 [Nitrosomonas sp.]|nr:hypothetical protein [Nitrosomonas sp.]
MAIYCTWVQATEPFALKIERKYVGADCTSGYLSINGTAQMYALERPWKDNQPLISSIPPGTYHGRLRYDPADRWRIELADVPDRATYRFTLETPPPTLSAASSWVPGLMPNRCARSPAPGRLR